MRDGATSQDEKAEISAQHTCLSINNPRPDQNESEMNPTTGGHGESSQDKSVMNRTATEEVIN